MLTEFGRELRHIRIDRDEKLKDMAGKLGVTTAYLSAVENGNRNIPDSWIEIIADEYQLDENEICRLEKLAYDGKPEITLNIGTASVGQRNLAYSFARKFKELSEEDVRNLQKFFGERSSKE